MAGLVCNGGSCVRCDHPDAGVQNGASAECAAADPDRPLCADDGHCVACRDKGDCAAKLQTCVAGACAPCTAHDQCTSRYCDDQGACGDPSKLVYVDQAGPSCPGGPGSGTLADPLCKIQVALAVAAGHTVVVLGGTYMENLAVDTPMMDTVETVVGIGMPKVKPAAFGQPLLSVQGDASHLIDLTFDGFVFDGADGDGVNCAELNGADRTRLTVRRSTIRGSKQYGVSASGCRLALDRDRIGDLNQQGGVYSQTSDVTIVNCLVFRNGTAGAGGSAFGGVYLASLGAGTSSLVNDTIVSNSAKATASASGLSCGLSAPVIANTVVVDNSGAALEITPNCAPLDHSAYAGGAAQVDLTSCMANGKGQVFVDPSLDDYHSAKTMPGACSLVGAGTVTSGPVSAPMTDLDGNPRPGAAGYDIGAYQVK